MEQFDESPPIAASERPPTRRESLVPALAVTAVAVVAVAAAVMAKRAEDVQPAQPQQARVEPVKPAPTQTIEVVRAPPLKAPDTTRMGGASACKDCGVVQTVVAVYDSGEKKPPRGYQMHIRMDDGTVRTIEQRGALAAGSRVVVEGSRVKPLS